MSRVINDPFWIQQQRAAAESGAMAFYGRIAGKNSALREQIRQEFGEEKMKELDETGETVIEVGGKRIRVVGMKRPTPPSGQGKKGAE